MKKKFIVVSILCLFVFISCSGKKDGKAEKLYIGALEQYQKQNLDQAYTLAKAAEKADSSFYQAYLLDGKILFFKSDYQHSAEVLQKLIRKYPSYTEARIWNIRCLIVAERYDEAEKLIKKELSFNPTDWRVLYLASLLNKKKENVEGQLIMLKNAEMALSDSRKVYMDASVTWEALGMKERSEKYLEKAKLLGDTE